MGLLFALGTLLSEQILLQGKTSQLDIKSVHFMQHNRARVAVQTVPDQFLSPSVSLSGIVCEHGLYLRDMQNPFTISEILHFLSLPCLVRFLLTLSNLSKLII